MLGDHQADLAQLLIGLIGRVNHLDAMAGVEGVGGQVVHIGEIAQAVLRVRHGRLHRLGARQALPSLASRRFQRFNGGSAQGIKQRCRNKKAASPRQICVKCFKNSSAQFLNLVSVVGVGGRTLFGLFVGQGGVCLPHTAILVGVGQGDAVWRGRQCRPDANTAVAGFLVQHAHPVHIAVAVDLGALAQILQAGQCVLWEDAPAAFSGVDGFGPVDGQAHQFLLQVVVAQAIAVVQGHGLVGQFQFNPVRAHLCHVTDGLPRVLGRIKGTDIVLAALHKVIGELAVEVLVGVGREGERGAAAAGPR